MNLENIVNRSSIENNTRAIEQLTDKITKELSELSETIKQQNRIGISVEKYESMKCQIALLKADNYKLKEYFSRIGLPYDLPIMSKSISVFCDTDYSNDVKKYIIRFDVDMAEMKSWDYCR